MPLSLQFPHGSGFRSRLWLTPAVGGVLLSGLTLALPAAATAATPSAKRTAAALVNSPVSGRVVDAKGEGLPGVTVLLEGTTLGSATDASGAYTISNVPAGSYTLVISSVGFTTSRQAITVVDGQPTQVSSITLNEDTQALKEVVVVGYGTLSRQELTTSVASVSAPQIERQRVAGFDQALQGQAPAYR
ncbi:carboxypeptidase-like regulatory domain-containing protein [Hymenobacter sp. 5414T-23]|uniref:carboxypeptidase-like regulatory domain-containing protein n=1 Tax=Hymenobacter sp. 5414T-23 TaxID=2932252 RepID=UPI001FD35672|nr:carboxypeptidase-like regulatory domain-containing protein [Hymenobacter sp. 5414T-23]UOQ82619.1 carboxypeptidase-like regulatory domain-containing protein [Hymenobacter sp. 5414T-23]